MEHIKFEDVQVGLQVMFVKDVAVETLNESNIEFYRKRGLVEFGFVTSYGATRAFCRFWSDDGTMRTASDSEACNWWNLYPIPDDRKVEQDVITKFIASHYSYKTGYDGEGVSGVPDSEGAP